MRKISQEELDELMMTREERDLLQEELGKALEIMNEEQLQEFYNEE